MSALWISTSYKLYATKRQNIDNNAYYLQPSEKHNEEKWFANSPLGHNTNKMKNISRTLCIAGRRTYRRTLCKSFVEKNCSKYPKEVKWSSVPGTNRKSKLLFANIRKCFKWRLCGNISIAVWKLVKWSAQVNRRSAKIPRTDPAFDWNSRVSRYSSMPLKEDESGYQRRLKHN